MRRTSMLSTVLLLSAMACGGSSSDDLTGTTNPIPGTGSMSATIDGKAWVAQGAGAVYKDKTLSITGLDSFSGSVTTGVTITVFTTGPGTFSLAFGNTVTGFGIVTKTPSSSWTTGTTGGTGSVVITTFTSNRAVGTFAFDAPASPGASGVTHVTNGKFDVTF